MKRYKTNIYFEGEMKEKKFTCKLNDIEWHIDVAVFLRRDGVYKANANDRISLLFIFIFSRFISFCGESLASLVWCLVDSWLSDSFTCLSLTPFQLSSSYERGLCCNNLHSG